MKRLATILFLFALVLTARAQYFAIGFDSNGVIQATGWIRGTNFFQTNLSRFMAAYTNDSAAKAWLSNNFAYLNRTNRFSQTNYSKGLEADFGQLRNVGISNATVTNLTGQLVGVKIQDVGSGLGPTAVFTNGSGSTFTQVIFDSEPGLFGELDFRIGGTNGWAISWDLENFLIDGAFGTLMYFTTNGLILGSDSFAVNINNLNAGNVQLTNVVGSNYVSGRFASKAGAYTSLVNGNNAGIPTGTNAVIEFSGASTIAQIAGFAATGDGDEFEARFTGAITNWIVNESGSSFSTDATAANRIVTGTGGDITQTNQPAWARFRYRGASSRWELKSWSR